MVFCKFLKTVLLGKKLVARGKLLWCLFACLGCKEEAQEQIYFAQGFFVVQNAKGTVYKNEVLEYSFTVKELKQIAEGKMLLQQLRLENSNKMLLKARQATVSGERPGLGSAFAFETKEIDYQDAEVLSPLKETIKSSSGKYNLQKQEIYGKGKTFFRKGFLQTTSESGFLYKNKEQELFLRGKVRGVYNVEK
jgi:hypothetical protein